jgi:hypothetical protein
MFESIKTRSSKFALKTLSISLIFSIVTGLFSYSLALAAGLIVLDGQFEDWDGQARVDDPQGDARNERTDIKAFFFATNPDEDNAYFMLERWEQKLLVVDYVLRIDTNNNGDYTESVDRRVDVNYDPSPNGFTDVELFDGTGSFLRTIANNERWGETKKGARVEWRIPFSDLGIAPFQTIRLQAVSMQGNKVSDEVAEVQWSPANALGKLVLASLAIAGGIFLFLRRKKIEWPQH